MTDRLVEHQEKLKAQARARANAWYHKNKDREEVRLRNAERVRKWRLNNLACARERERKYRENNRETRAHAIKNWKNRNKQRIRDRASLYYEARIKRHGREHINKINREYKRANRDKCNVITQNRRCLERAAPGNFTNAEWIAVCERFGWTCPCCGKCKPLTRDHIVPILRGGDNFISNIQPLCKSCNSRKNNKIIICYLPWRENKMHASDDKISLEHGDRRGLEA